MPRKRQDLTGKRYGKLTVVGYSGLGSNTKQKFSEWLCQCDCGNTCIVAGYMLQAGRRKSCGCLHVAPEKLAGQRFGKLTVLQEDKEQGTTLRKVICRCDCGNTKSIAFRDLKNGRITSCGCDRIRASRKKSYFEAHMDENLRQKRSQFVSGEYKKICTLEEWIFIWVYEVLPDMVKESTLATYKNILEKHVIPEFGKRKLADITSADVEKWMERLKKEKVSGTIGDSMRESTLCNTLSVLNSCMRDAKKYRLIEKNPCPDFVEIVPVSARNENRNYLEEDQAVRLAPLLLQYQGEENYPLGIGFWLIMYTGLLLSEAVALRWRDVDMDQKFLTVRSFVSLKGQENTGSLREYCLGQTSGSRKREVPIPEFFVRRLGDLKTQFSVDEAAFVVNPYSKHPVSLDRMRAALARTGIQAGLGRVTPQMLRDTYAMRAVRAGATSDMIAELMGLSSAQQVVKRYMSGTSAGKWDLVSRMYGQYSVEDKKDSEDHRYPLSCIAGNG